MSTVFIVVIMTLGSGIDEKSASCFENGDYMRGMIFDSIGISVLKDISHRFLVELAKKARESGYGVTRPISPGCDGWDIKDQSAVFELFNAKEFFHKNHTP